MIHQLFMGDIVFQKKNIFHSCNGTRFANLDPNVQRNLGVAQPFYNFKSLCQSRAALVFVLFITYFFVGSILCITFTIRCTNYKLKWQAISTCKFEF